MIGILVDERTGDLLIRNGKIAVGDNTLQCVEQIIKSSRGEYKEFPLIGGECFKLLHGNYSRFWPNRVKKMCQFMGISLKEIDYDVNGKIRIAL